MVTVEPAAAAEAAAVTDLWIALATEQRAHGSHLHAADNRDAIRESMAQHAVENGLIVARDGDDLVGFVRFDIERGPLAQDRTRGVVRDLYVEPVRRDEGIGARLLDAAEAALRDRGVEIVALEALAANADAIRFYERQGYRPHRIEFEREVENDKRPRGDR
ncbi:GNAT family N-acetyltransferase [Haloplanus aerogenes]|uniref:GNAT family N-acetyltransferase n=1 Tax=Haloplanus aerogenes TaxID=660522 RepID=A0A3M0ECD1_9EURY|nr:GNAT family N-acetyltransferase [Haloplanus aerogenes]AZH25745.1 GNAT family N-acetyltransferase [Haloplanus aerogenes]RMB25480.1 ribosomal protein S18 acetylase RimI-like enzyme [Haloplanus aerogenes]